MKFSFTQASMMRGLQKVMGAVPTRMPMPSLGNLYLKLEDGELDVTATDLEITITARVDLIDSDGEGSVLVQAKRFQDLVRELPDIPLELEVQEPLKVMLKGEGVGVYTLPGGDPIDFPDLPPVEAKLSFSILGETFNRMINKVMFAVSHDEMRPILTGILMQLRPGELRVVATDGHRLSRMIRRNVAYTGEPRDVVVPMKALNLFTRGVDNEDTPVIGFAETRASFTANGQKLTTRLIDGHYPKYESVIPESNPSRLVVNTGEIMSSIKRVSIFANQISRQVKLGIDAETMTLETEDQDLGGKGEEKIAVQFEGEHLDIAYNSVYIMDVLKQIDTDEVVFELNGQNDAAVIKATSRDDDEDFLMLLMPIRLK